MMSTLVVAAAVAGCELYRVVVVVVVVRSALTVEGQRRSMEQ